MPIIWDFASFKKQEHSYILQKKEPLERNAFKIKNDGLTY